MPVPSLTAETNVGCSVIIDGLTSNVDLNRYVGTVTEDPVQGERWTVQVVQVLKDGVQPKVRNVSVRRVNCTMALQPIGWSASRVNAVLQPWATRCAAQDPRMWQKARENLYTYLELKAFYVVNTKRAIRPGGYVFADADRTHIRRCLLWSNGRSEASQMDVLAGEGGPDEKWWPCIVICRPGIMETHLASYCPGLALSDGRPWLCHASRVRSVQTPGPVIEEIGEESDDQWNIIN